MNPLRHPLNARRTGGGETSPAGCRVRGHGGRARRAGGCDRSHGSGFTIIEIVITLSIIALLVALALGSTITLSHTRALQEPISKVQEFAKKARNLAIIEQRPYMLEITPHSVSIFSLVSTAGETAGGFGSAEAAAPKGRIDHYEFDADVTLTVRRWRGKEFELPSRQVWVFERSGLCEPLAVRASSENGYIEVSFNALDAHVEDNASEIR